MALSIAYQCLWECSLLLNEYLKTGYEGRLAALTERYMKEHKQRAVESAGGASGSVGSDT